MRRWIAARVAAAAGAELFRDARAGPEHVVIDSREAGPGALFVGIPGQRVDGGAFAADVLGAGAWGVLITPERAREALAADTGGAVLAAPDPVAALGLLGRAWRRELGCPVIAVTGSTGKTSTKDILAALLAPARRTVASRANLNTEIGLPLQILTAPPGTEVLVLELAMRGPGQIAELGAIAEPDVGVIVNVGPVHLELLGSLEAVAAAKAELLAALPPGRGTAIVPRDEPLLAPHLRADVETLAFGPGGDAALLAADGSAVEIELAGERVAMELSFTRPHLRTNLLAALLAARAIGVDPPRRLEVAFSAGRGDRIEAPNGVLVLDDCYNANPMSMRAALDDLAATAAARGGRRVAVLGDMLELGPDEVAYHEELGRQAARSSVDVLVTVGPLAAAATEPFGGHAERADDAAQAAALLPSLLEPGDTVLVKASNGVGLAEVSRRLAAPALVDS